MCVVSGRLLDSVCDAEQKTYRKRDIYREMLQEPHRCPVTTVTHTHGTHAYITQLNLFKCVVYGCVFLSVFVSVLCVVAVCGAVVSETAL